uniref:Pectinesterase inhibitor domain-containing protein n=1 Tax=Ananas comosus var. bracteatus TaxID=296719 RepID=A0A6V7NEG1_ANACO|nr:unnamed protein product [Ananas comosus var. bracteatus]
MPLMPSASSEHLCLLASDPQPSSPPTVEAAKLLCRCRPPQPTGTRPLRARRQRRPDSPSPASPLSPPPNPLDPAPAPTRLQLPREHCDSVDRLRNAAVELIRTGRSDSPAFRLAMSNIRTWCSAALTETTASTASPKPAAAKLDPQRAREVLAVAQVTSKALALLNRVAPQQ